MYPLGSFSLALTVGLTLAGCRKPLEHPPAHPLPRLPVRVQRLEPRTRSVTEAVVGTVRSKRRSVLEAKVSGRITTMPVVLGQQVQSGELLVRLDIQETQARLEQARAVLDQTEQNLKRYQTLLRQASVTQQEFDAVETRYRVAKASVAETETMLGYTEIRAPFTGVVRRKLAEVGDLAVPGKPLIELEDRSAYQFEADIPESLIDRLGQGDRLTVRVASLEEKFKGVVTEIAPSADPDSRTFPVKLNLSQNKNLKAGQFGRVAVPTGTRTILVVPTRAVVIRGQMEIVFVAEDRRARMRLVKTGKRLDGGLEIVSGLHAGESIVVEGAGRLRDGQPLAPQP